MSRRFEVLDWSETRLGELMLRRRHEPTLDLDVFEVRLGDEFLMSSLFTVAERRLAELGLAAHPARSLDVLVGGLGLGYTALAALAEDRVASLTVIEALEPVIGWHRRRLLPDVAGLADDPRCDLVHADFFALVESGGAGRRYDVVLLDVDHTPDHVLAPAHARFYSPEGVSRLGTLLQPDGVFALWSDDPPDPSFEAAPA